MTLSWSAPSSNGGCTITSYHIYMNDGLGGSVFTEVDAATVSNSPSLRQYPITFTATDTGNEYEFYLVCENAVGSITSETVSFVLASTPDQPPTAPYLSLTETTSYQI